MSIQLTITFGALIGLCAITGMLLAPLPLRVLGAILAALEQAAQNKTGKVALAMFTAITAMSFLDAVRVGMLQANEDIVEFSSSVWDLRAKKFYSQRNMYIFGFILYLEVALVFVGMLVKSRVKNGQKLAQLAQQTQPAQSDAANGADTHAAKLKKLQTDVDALREQYENNAKGYDAAFERDPKATGEKKNE